MKRPSACPAFVTLGPVDYAIEELPETLAREAVRLGDSDHIRTTIRIDFSLPDRVVGVTMLHEILHCIWDSYSIGTKSSEERTVEALSNGFAAVWRNNPKLVRWLNAMLKEGE